MGRVLAAVVEGAAVQAKRTLGQTTIWDLHSSANPAIHRCALPQNIKRQKERPPRSWGSGRQASGLD